MACLKKDRSFRAASTVQVRIGAADRAMISAMQGGANEHCPSLGRE
jgi:hypothetical protein